MTKIELQMVLDAIIWNMDYLPSVGYGTTKAKEAIAILKAELDKPDDPVKYQARVKPTEKEWTPEWAGWEDCTKEEAADYRKIPTSTGWNYEVRELYTRPQSCQCDKPTAECDALKGDLAHRTASLMLVTAERDALKAIAESDDGAGGEGMKLHLENRKLSADNAALKADAEMYRQIRAGNFTVLGDGTVFVKALAIKGGVT
jgi:hypothetical protein